MQHKKILSAIVGLMGCLLLTDCSKNIAPGDYDAAEVGKIKKVVPGTIISMRPVRLHSKNDDLNSQPVAVDSNRVNKSHGYEYVIKLNSGSIISVVQAESIKLKARQHILVIYGANTRVVPDNGSDDF